MWGRSLVLLLALVVGLSAPTGAKQFFRHAGGAASGITPVITFNAPSASYIYPSAPTTALTTVTATVTAGPFLGGGGTFTSSNCAASDITVASDGAVTVAGSNLTGSQSCLITAMYPGAVSVTQTFTLTGTQQTIASITSGAPCTLGGGCNYTFTVPAAPATLDTVPTVTMSGGITFAAGGGTVVLGSGLQCSDFAISGTSLQITATPAATYACTYVITDANASNSPQTVNISAVGSSNPTTNIVAVQITNENVVPAASVGTVIGDLSANYGLTTTGATNSNIHLTGLVSTAGVTTGNTVIGPGIPAGTTVTTLVSSSAVDISAPSTVTAAGAQIVFIFGSCSTCTYSMVNSGLSNDSVACNAGSNNFQVGTDGGTGLPAIEVLNGSLTQHLYGYSAPNAAFICVKATPAVGSAYTFPFSVMVRGNQMTGVAPRTVVYSGTQAPGTHIATMSAFVHGTAGTQTVALASQTGDNCSLLTVSGQDLVVGGTALTTQNFTCHVTVSQTGVTCPISGSTSATPAACTVDVWVRPSPYVGPCDSTYDNGAPGLPWTVWTMPYACSAAYAASGGPIWRIIRESDRAHFVINALPNGDMDLLTLAADCDQSMCVGDGEYTGGLNGEPDQSGNSPTNDLFGEADNSKDPGFVTQHRAYVYFNAANGVMPEWVNSNATDKFWLNSTTYNGSGSTGTMWAPGLTYNTALTNIMADLAAVGSASNPDMYLQYIPGTTSPCGGVLSVTGCLQIKVGPDNGTVLATTGNTNSNIHLTGLASTTGVVVGDGVTAAGVPIGATVATLVSSSAVDISAPATSSTSGETVTFTNTVITSAPVADSTFHSNLVVVDLASSILDVDGVKTTGTLSTGSFVKWVGQGGGYGGGSNTGFSPGMAVSPTTADQPSNLGQLSALCTFDMIHLGTAGPCP